MNRPHAHTFRGRRYRIKWRKPKDRKHGGYCENPKGKNPEITIHPELDDENLLRVVIDEGIHACFYDLDNESVGEASTDIAAFRQDSKSLRRDSSFGEKGCKRR